jgi:hypothetical protein
MAERFSLGFLGQHILAVRGGVSAIKSDVAAIRDRLDNPLKHAPHTADLLIADWTRPYPKEQAFFPTAATRNDKYWPPVARVDNAYGDRHLVCAYPPLEASRQAAE